MRREERVTVQGPVKEQQPDGMSHSGWTPPPRPTRPPPLLNKALPHPPLPTRRGHEQEQSQAAPASGTSGYATPHPTSAPAPQLLSGAPPPPPEPMKPACVRPRWRGVRPLAARFDPPWRDRVSRPLAVGQPQLLRGPLWLCQSLGRVTHLPFTIYRPCPRSVAFYGTSPNPPAPLPTPRVLGSRTELPELNCTPHPPGASPCAREMHGHTRVSRPVVLRCPPARVVPAACVAAPMRHPGTDNLPLVGPGG